VKKRGRKRIKGRALKRKLSLRLSKLLGKARSYFDRNKVKPGLTAGDTPPQKNAEVFGGVGLKTNTQGMER